MVGANHVDILRAGKPTTSVVGVRQKNLSRTLSGIPFVVVNFDIKIKKVKSSGVETLVIGCPGRLTKANIKELCYKVGILVQGVKEKTTKTKSRYSIIRGD